MATGCTCLPGGPRDPACPLTVAHEAMDEFAAGLREMGDGMARHAETMRAEIEDLCPEHKTRP